MAKATLNPAYRTDLQDEGERENSPEVRLWRAVVLCVWNDAFVSTNTWIRNSERTRAPDLVRAEARRWLLLDFGKWREDREETCVRAGVDPDEIHKAAIRRNKLAHVEDLERNRLEREAIDRAMESLAAREHRLTKGAICSALSELVAREMALA